MEERTDSNGMDLFFFHCLENDKKLGLLFDGNGSNRLSEPSLS